MPLSDTERRRWMRRVTADQNAVVREYTPQVRNDFNIMATGLLRNYLNSATVTAALVGVDEGNVALAQTLANLWIASGARAGQQIAEFVSAPVSTAVEAALQQQGANRVRFTRRRTREAVRRAIDVGVRAGLTHRDIALGRGRLARRLAEETGWRPLNQVVRETYRNRALTIARTETALAHQFAAHLNYAYHDVTHVEFLDSAECGLRNHDDPEKANGMILTVAQASRYPLSHPNCVRASAPVVD